MWDQIGQYRFYRHIPTEAEAIRQLIQNGLNFGATVQTVLALVTGQMKFIPGPFSAAGRDSFAIIEQLAAEIARYQPSLSREQIHTLAEQGFNRAMQAGRTEVEVAASLLNLDWRWFVG
jgi:hypothetical protein